MRLVNRRVGFLNIYIYKTYVSTFIVLSILAAFYTPFFKEVWEKKPEIEQAFHMEEPAGLDDSGEGALEHPRSQRCHGPMPPPRHESYHLKLNDGYKNLLFF